MITENPLTWQSYNLDPNSKGYAATMKLFQKALSNWAVQMQKTLTNPSILASILNSAYLLTQAQGLFLVVSTPTTNQTVDTNRNPIVFIRYNWTTAANFTLTLNNVVDGQILMLYFSNSSGAPRTITVAAKTVSSVGMTVSTGSSQLSLGATLANNVAGAFFAMASATNLLYYGVGQNW